MRSCDKELYKFNKIKKNFTGNGFWLSHRFNEVYFLEIILKKLIRKYKIEIIMNYKILNFKNIEFSINDLSFSNIFDISNDRLLRLIIIGLKEKINYVTSSKIKFLIFI